MTTELDDVKVYVLNALGQRIGELDDYTSLKAKKVWNDVGTLQIEVSRQTHLFVELLTPGNGIELYNHGIDLNMFYGWLDIDDQKFDATTDSLTVTFNDDNVWLAYRLVHPSPTESLPPYDVQAYDTITAQGSTALCHYVDNNLGTSAIAARQILGTTSVDAAFGNTITAQGRWENLLTFLQDTATSSSTDLGFRVDRPGGTALQFVTYSPTDKTADVKFSTALGNLTAGSIKITSPKATYVYAGGSGDLTARLIAEAQDSALLADWGRREYFYDINNISDSDDLATAAAKSVVDNGLGTDFAVTVTNTESQRYGVDYELGDKVSAIFIGSEPLPSIGSDNGEVQEVIRQIDFTIDGNERSIIPTIATPTRTDVLRVFTEIKKLRADLQRRQNN